MDEVNRVLITSSGRRSYLVEYFKEVLGSSGKVYAADCDPLAPVFGDCDHGFVVPPFDEDDYISSIRNICVNEDVDLVIPTNDRELQIFAENKDVFKEKETRVLISEPRCIDIANDKISTYEFLTSNGILTPFTTSDLDIIKEKIDTNEIELPVIVKPRFGSGSEDVYEASSMDELKLFWNRIDRPIAQEKLQGQEYGVDVFNNHDREPISIVPRKKIAMRAGETDKAVSVDEPELMEIGKTVGETLGHLGPLDIDCFYDGDRAYVMELNARFGGGYPLTHLAGGDFVAAAVSIGSGEKVDPRIGDFDSGTHMIKTYRIYSPESDRGQITTVK
ncbi:ATP-grasp domain-containing protein [Halalkaliarchaeum sp. AArc-GB]|uniref:ATP-grasp domain-containing protein n=1 Tax=Halalkaliarchaeum sp. AArc-GB TaxID=3074078 RepID=UPI002857ABB3|nr:ATP-grasp domain-containing protein [Halalkaliarchaeum sp. AArc-GB]MDR5674227.1 ATP-grasp domain-containing protein [Halalkaliarchaeum sp. AArc-GB]